MIKIRCNVVGKQGKIAWSVNINFKYFAKHIFNSDCFLALAMLGQKISSIKYEVIYIQ